MSDDGPQIAQLAIFGVLFAAVTVMGFAASRWKPGNTIRHLDEWGLGGRKFGSWVTWFLIGGNIYTAYTFVAVPALMFGAGAVGFFAVPYAIVLYPLIMLPLVRLWSVSRVRGYVTPADFVRGRYSSPTLALLVALTGIVATMPYIALQLVGLEAVFRTMGLNESGWLGHLPLLVAFALLSLYTYQSGLRAPAMIAFVKDILIFLVVFVAVLYLPVKLGSWSSIFNAAGAKFSDSPNPSAGLLLGPNNQLYYATLALGSALALFLYPHALTSALAARSRDVLKKNMTALPVYSLMLAMLALLGYAAIAGRVVPVTNNATGKADPNTIIPALFEQQFPAWFAGLAMAAIGIGALVPAAIMSIAAANLWTRNVYKEYLRRDATPGQEAGQARLASLVVKVGAVLFIVALDPQFAIDLQLVGGLIILQTLPAVAISLYTRWLHRNALIAGWAAGMATGLWLLYQIPNPAAGRAHFGGTSYPLAKLGLFGWHPLAGSTETIYAGIIALLVNLVVAVALTVLLRQLRVDGGRDATEPTDYLADEGSAALPPVAGDPVVRTPTLTVAAPSAKVRPAVPFDLSGATRSPRR